MLASRVRQTPATGRQGYPFAASPKPICWWIQDFIPQIQNLQDICLHAPLYKCVVLLFHGVSKTTSQLAFNAGQLITVSVNKPGCHDRHSMFGFVYEVMTLLT